MSIINNYNNPVVHNWNRDQFGEPTSLPRENESKPVLGGKIALEEIPDSYRRIFIDGYMEIDLKQKIIDEFHYKVDYTNGIVFFHSSKEGQTINITRYYGRGMFYIPSSRVWSKIDDLGNVVSTLADMEGDLGEISSQIGAINDMAENASGIATSLETNMTIGTTLNSNLQTSINTATTKKSDLDSSISTANTSKSSLDTSISNANTSKSNLDTSIGNANTSKSNLDSSISSGNTLKTNLDGNIATGTALKNNLDTNIATGNQLKIDLPPLVSDANTAKTNLDGSIATSVSKKSDLDGSISSATTKKSELDNSISSANTINNTLSNSSTGTIKKATDINTTLNASIGTANTSKSNLDTSVGVANTNKINLDGSISTANATKTALDGSISTGNNLKGELDAIISGTDYEILVTNVESLQQDQHSHDNKENVLDGLSDDNGKLKYKGQDVGIGDMAKAKYDIDGDGKVDVANNAEKLGGQLPSYYAKITDIPNKLSELDNDSGFISSGFTWGEAKGV